MIVTALGFVINNEGELLVLRSKKMGPFYLLPGGEVHVGERLQEAFIRQVFEETGLRLAHVRYVKFDEVISDRHVLMHCFFAHLAPGFDKHDIRLGEEYEKYLWAPPDKLRELAISDEMHALLDVYEVSEGAHGLIGFDNLKIKCCIGVLPKEKKRAQPLFIDLRVQKDLMPCVFYDDVEKTVDYTKLAACCEEIASRGYGLVETYAHAVLEEVIKKFALSYAWIKVRKPKALPKSDGAVVELARGKKWASH